MVIGLDARLWDQTGVGRYIRNLVLSLYKIDKKNKYVLFLRKEDFGAVQKLIKNPNWKLVEADIKWHGLDEQKSFPKILNRENLDLVHFPYFSLPVFYNRPFVITIHDLIINHFPTGQASTLFPILYYLKVLGYKFITNTAAKKARKIIVPSNATKDEVVDHLKINKDKIIVTYEGFDINISPSHKVIEGKTDGKYFLYVGNAYPHKNLETLVEAFEIFREKNTDAKLILVGGEDYFYKKLKDKTKDERIVFFGKATDGELSYLYKNALALIAPSHMEGFGLPVLEAMASKCLVICSDILSFKEIAKETAIYFDPKNADDLKEKMEDVYSNHSKFANLWEKAYKRSGDFSWEKMAEETLKIYESSVSLR